LFTNAAVAGLGGSAQADALATERFWTRMIIFLDHIPASTSRRPKSS
jgi:hypothetical protein